MLCKVFCACCKGLEVFTVTVEVDVSDGINFFLVGLADSAVKESQQRIGSAISKFGYRIPGKKIVINMAPANIRKEGSAYDLAIAVAIVSASGQISLSSLDDYIIMGELALDGTLRPITGALPIILHARECGYKGCILPLESAKEGAEIDGIKVYGAETFKDVVDILQDPSLCNNKLVKYNVVEYAGSTDYDFADIKGQEQAKKGLEIAASGGHNVIMIGAPGTGKTYMAKCLNSIMPKLSKRESLETSKIYSVAGLLGDNLGLIKERPFRQPHHTSSIQSLAGALGMPGEVSLAHNGILFADELAEFPRSLLELLRQPLEDREIQICRARTRVCYPASFMFVAAMNPCPCGYYNQPGKVCNCSVSSIMKYRNKLSGPLMDRIDIQLRVLPVSASEIVGESG
ncbi:MAG: YifB family Mg chelatase-like AAA ATPase, partial [Bacteroidales bacterium]|nr:YifB family Mg chelatase-like AAA ATPase [Bacteroidales bacterium]